MGLHSTLFGPVKYAYLPQHLDERELTGGNGMVEMGTFVAILLGTMAGGLLIAVRGRRRAASPAAVCRSRRRGRPHRGAVRAAFARPEPRPAHQLESVHRDAGATSSSRTATSRSSTRCSASRGCGSSARCSSRSSRRSRKEVLHGDETSSRSCSRCSRSASASARCCARRLSGRQGRDRPGAVRLDRHDACSRSTCISPRAACTPRPAAWCSASWPSRALAHLFDLFAARLLRRASTPCRCTR